MSRPLGAAANLPDAVPVFAALGDDTRLRLVARLCEGGPLSIVRLARGAKVSRQAITKHLQALEEARLVHSYRSGRERIWELKPARLDEARRYLDQVSRQWDAALGRLQALVEQDGRERSAHERRRRGGAPRAKRGPSR